MPTGTPDPLASIGPIQDGSAVMRFISTDAGVAAGRITKWTDRSSGVLVLPSDSSAEALLGADGFSRNVAIFNGSTAKPMLVAGITTLAVKKSGNGDVTIMALVKPGTTTGSFSLLLSVAGPNGPGDGYVCGIYGSSNRVWSIQRMSGSSPVGAPTSQTGQAVLEGQWQLVTFRLRSTGSTVTVVPYSGGTGNTGNAVNTAPTGAVAASVSVVMGGYVTLGNAPFVGSVAGLSVYSRALTSSEETSVANDLKTPLPPAVATVLVSASGMLVGQTFQATAVTEDSGDNVLTGRTVSWASSDTSIATVDASGLVTGVAAGSANITASAEGVVGSATVAVTAPIPPVSINVGTSGSSIDPGGTTTLTPVGSGGTPVTGPFTWTTSDPTVATVSPTGVVTGGGVGTATITAIKGTTSVSQVITITRGTLTVSVDNNRIPVAGTAQMSSVFHNAAGDLVPAAQVRWSSSNPGLAMVDAAGVVHGDWVGPDGPTGYGVVTITGSYNGLAAPVDVTVYQPWAVLPDQTASAPAPQSVAYPTLPDQRAARPAYPANLKVRGILWSGAVFTFPYLDNWATWSEPRIGGFPETGFPSGVQCAWQMPADHFASFDARYIEPVADGTLGVAGNSWNGASGLRRLIEAMRSRSAFTFYPDYLNHPELTTQVVLVEPMTGGVVLENDLTRRAIIVLRSNTEFTGE
jgi:uncharacterized protein YjdB